MNIAAENLSPGKRVKKNVKRLGRGNASGKGTYSARGLKGQKSRSGGRGGLKLKGFKQSLQKVPKLRGFKSPHKKPETVTLERLQAVCNDGETVTPYLLHERGVISAPKRGAKIVATGSLEKKLNFEGCVASKGALEAIEKAGGKMTF